MNADRQPVVLILNNSSALVRTLAVVCESVGMRAHQGTLDKTISDEDAMRAEIEAVAPDVVVCDIAPPVQENWEKFRRVHTAAAPYASLFVVTSSQELDTNELPDYDESIILVGKPYDMFALADRIRQILEESVRGGDSSPESP